MTRPQPRGRAHRRGRIPARWAAGALALLLAALLPAPVTAAPPGGPPGPPDPPPAGPSSTGQQLAVPAYFYPGGEGEALWQQLFDAGGGAHGSVGIAVANPSSGPGAQRDPQYGEAISAAVEAGITVLGYVATGYLGSTGRATRLAETTPAAWHAQVQQEIAQWYALYGDDGLGGIFFDEVQNVCGPDGDWARTYRDLDRHTKRAHPGAFTVINPGIDTEKCYADIGDVILTIENTYQAYVDWQPPAWHGHIDPRRLWHLVHTAGTEQDMAHAMQLARQRNAGYVYVTPDVLANPWDTLPDASYWSAQLAAAASADTRAPTRPGRPVAVKTGATTMTLAWLPARDPGGRVAGYDVLLDGVRVAGTLGAVPLVTLEGLDPDRSYQVSVVARDRSGNRSGPGPVRTLATRAAAAAPAAPADLHATDVRVASTRLGWTASAGAVAYDVSLDGAPLLSLPAWLYQDGDQVSVPVSGLSPGTGYEFTVTARHGTGSVSAAAGPLVVTTELPSGDPITEASGVIDGDVVTYRARFHLPYDFHHVYIDVDSDETTGFEAGGTGADYLIENGWFYRHVGTGWSWEPVDAPSPLVSFDDDVWIWQVPLSTLGDPGPHRVVFRGGGGGSAEHWTEVIDVS